MRTTGILLLVLSLMALAFLPEAKAGANYTSFTTLQGGYSISPDTRPILAASEEQVLISEGILTIEEQETSLLQPKNLLTGKPQPVSILKLFSTYSTTKGLSAAMPRAFLPAGP